MVRKQPCLGVSKHEFVLKIKMPDGRRRVIMRFPSCLRCGELHAGGARLAGGRPVPRSE
jgi:hypothetical protein